MTQVIQKTPIFGLTLHQPWADLILLGEKTIENRSWQPARHLLGCYLALHAGQTYDFFSAFMIQKRFGIEPREDGEVHKGKIIAVARLDQIVTESDDPWFFGPYGWCLRDVTPIEPVSCRGARRLWDLPSPILNEVRKNFAAVRSQ
jgi:hypothetical protein